MLLLFKNALTLLEKKKKKDKKAFFRKVILREHDGLDKDASYCIIQ